jgi:hypothetical protein
MFSPDASVQNTLSLRNPRRRNRTTSQDSLATQQSLKRRKRSSLAPDTFDAPVPAAANGHAPHANGFLKDHTPDRQSIRDASVETTSLVVRGRGNKRSDKRTRREDTGVQVRLRNMRTIRARIDEWAGQNKPLYSIERIQPASRSGRHSRQRYYP